MLGFSNWYGVISESIHDRYLFKSVFMAGGPGSGKSFISNEMFSGLDVMLVDSDDIFTHLLRKEGLPLDIDPSDVDRHEAQTVLWKKGLNVK